MTSLSSRLHRLLRSSEKYTKTDMVYLSRGGTWLTLGQVVSAVASFLLTIAFANLLPQETYGTYKYILSVCGILAIPALSEMSTAIIHATSRGDEGAIFPAFFTKIRWAALGGIGSLFVAGYYLYAGNTLLAVAFLIAAIFIPIMDAPTLYDSVLQGKKDFRRSVSYSAISQVIYVTTIVGMLFLTKELLFVLLAYFVSITASRYYFFRKTLHVYPPNNKHDEAVIPYGKHMSVIKGLNTLVGGILGVFIFHFAGSAALAVYTIALAPIERVRGLLGILSNLLLPKIAHHEWEIPSFLSFCRKMTVPFMILLAGILGYIGIAPLLYHAFFPRYLDSIFYSQLFALSLLFTFATIILSTILRGKRKTKEQYVTSIIDMATSLGVAIPALYFWGLTGLILGLTINKIINTVALSFAVFGQNPRRQHFEA